MACADPDESAARRAAGAAPGASVHGSVESVLERAAVDAVLVATPHDELAGSSLAAIRAGKHVMVDKPMAMDDVQAREVESAVDASGVNYMVGYSLRFSTGKYVHELIAGGHIGDVDAVTGTIGMPPMNRNWMSTTEHGGGPLLYIGCHMVDFVFWFASAEPLSVYADVRRRADTGTDELSGIQIHLGNGSLAQLLVAQTRPAFAYAVHVYGRTGDIGLRGRNLFQPELEVFSSSTPEYREPATIRPVLRGDAIALMLVPELDEFARSITEKRKPAVTAADGRRALQVLDAVRESARSGGPVEIRHPELAGR